MKDTLLELQQIDMRFNLPGHKVLAALSDVTLAVQRGEVLGIVGESGCGKSTLARVIMGLYPPAAGQLLYEGKPLALRTGAQRMAHARQAQMIFQNSHASLNPRLKIGQIVGEGFDIHLKLSENQRCQRVNRLLTMVGLLPEHADRYPHEFSGGQRQRIGIARALALEPKLLVCDEPISALDLSVQSQIVNLLFQLHKDMGLTILFIAHDLNMVRYLSDRIAVMYMGQLMELAPADAICTTPHHPYTAMLLGAVLQPNPDDNRLAQPPAQMSEIASPILPMVGCPFASRCPHSTQECTQPRPAFVQQQENRWVACHHPL